MNKDTLKRLKGLEARQRSTAAGAGLTSLHRLQVRALAILMGELTEQEAIAGGFARALGYGGPRELREAMRAKSEGRSDPDGFDARWRRALLALCERYGLNPETAGEAELGALLARHEPNGRAASCPT
jgi:hypothetical protein